MRAFLDTNVVCDWLLKREPWRADAESIAERIANGQLVCLVAATTVTNLFYIARKLVGRDAAAALVGRRLTSFEIWSVDAQVLQAALSVSGGDFEDNVQLIVALEAAADCVVTRDSKGFKGAAIKTLTPNQFLAELRAPPP
jgi:Predicted nucleic acid-binding protein, contains PIN domain